MSTEIISDMELFEARSNMIAASEALLEMQYGKFPKTQRYLETSRRVIELLLSKDKLSSHSIEKEEEITYNASPESQVGENTTPENEQHTIQPDTTQGISKGIPENDLKSVISESIRKTLAYQPIPQGQPATLEHSEKPKASSELPEDVAKVIEEYNALVAKKATEEAKAVADNKINITPNHPTNTIADQLPTKEPLSLENQLVIEEPPIDSDDTQQHQSLPQKEITGNNNQKRPEASPVSEKDIFIDTIEKIAKELQDDLPEDFDHLEIFEDWDEENWDSFGNLNTTNNTEPEHITLKTVINNIGDITLRDIAVGIISVAKKTVKVTRQVASWLLVKYNRWYDKNFATNPNRSRQAKKQDESNKQ